MTQDPAWPGFNDAMPEQVVELIGVMLAHGYPESAVEDILGATICGCALRSGAEGTADGRGRQNGASSLIGLPLRLGL
jgi:hypothetical protein